MSRLQIVSASVDELTCRFVDTVGRKHIIHANITVIYNKKYEYITYIIKIAKHIQCNALTKETNKQTVYSMNV